MKKIVVLMLGVSLLGSCKKCAECTVETTVYVNDFVTGESTSTTNSVTEEYCDKKKHVEEWKSDMEALDYNLVFFGNGTKVETTCRDI